MLTTRRRLGRMKRALAGAGACTALRGSRLFSPGSMRAAGSRPSSQTPDRGRSSWAARGGPLPLVFVQGPGAAARNSIGIVLVGGMAIGTLFTLFVVPVFYSLIAARHVAVPAEPEAEPVEPDVALSPRTAEAFS